MPLAFFQGQLAVNGVRLVVVPQYSMFIISLTILFLSRMNRYARFKSTSHSGVFLFC